MSILVEERPATQREATEATRLSPADSRRRDLWIIAALTVLALVLRLWGLGHESVWCDEAVSLQLARAPIHDLLIGAPDARDNGNPAGYFVLLRLWILALGGASIENARALSAVAGALSVPAVWLLAWRLPRPAGLLAALLVALSPPLIYLSQEARVFALFTTVATLTAACVAVIEDKERSKGNAWSWIGFAALGALMVHLHYYAAFVLAALGLHLAIWGWFHDRRALWKLGLSALVVVAAFLPWLGVFRWQLQQGATRSEGTWWEHLALLPLFDLGGRTLIWKEYGVAAVAAADLAVAAVVFVPLGWLLLRARPFPWLPFAFAAGVPGCAALVALKTPMIHSHYLSCIIPAVLLLLACALVAGWRSGRRRLIAAPALALILVTAASLGRLYAEPHKDDWRGLAARVDRDGGEAPVYFDEDIGADPFGYYDPARSAIRLTAVFGRDGDGWEQSGDLGRMRAEPDGFWLVLYLPGRSPDRDGAPVVERLQREFAVASDETLGRMRLLRFRPQASAEGDSPRKP
jgi:mannosyltransferase